MSVGLRILIYLVPYGCKHSLAMLDSWLCREFLREFMLPREQIECKILRFDERDYTHYNALYRLILVKE